MYWGWVDNEHRKDEHAASISIGAIAADHTETLSATTKERMGWQSTLNLKG